MTTAGANPVPGAHRPSGVRLHCTGYAATLSRSVKSGALSGPQVTVTAPVRAARTVTRVTPLPSVTDEVTSASIGLLLRGGGQAPRARGSSTTVTVVPERTHRSRTEAPPALWVIVAEPAWHSDDAEAVAGGVAVPLGGDDGVRRGGAVADGDAEGEAG
ncbi:hypothetical protein GCM10010508_37720 [Streptomyces naganishii JCM 4654]|uniref:Uncharacterized protein n=1 Tax=Streptomyces naganishii JCM 4654 TaxID=1306179 RepID=A0A918Y4Y4_9ACTN|nr:hypothetical protein GCM10010508_37720 [Streptomyces naganishii JCM 4654]